MKKLYRTREERLVSGVFGGLGIYFNIDPTILRIAFVFFVLVTGFFPGVIAYILAIAIIPLEEEKADNSKQKETVVDVEAEEK